MAIRPSVINTAQLVDKYINTAYDKVVSVADNIDSVVAIADVITDNPTFTDSMDTVAENVADITNFNDVYQGAKATDPALRNDGSVLQSGDLYFNTSINALRAYSGSIWVSGTAGTMDIARFSGNGLDTAFTLPMAPVSENNTQVYLNGVYQQKDTYSVSGTTLTFSEAPIIGTDNIEVVIISTASIGETDASLVSYTSSGAGTVSHTIKFEFDTQIVNVFRFMTEAEIDGCIDGSVDVSTAVATAYTHCKTDGGELYFPPGIFKGKFTFNGEASVRGAGKRRTKLIPSDTASYCVRLYGSGGDAGLGATLSNLSIISTTKTGQGLYCGDASGSGFSNGCVENIEIRGFEDNIFIRSAIMSSFRNIWSVGGVYGLRMDGEANVTTCHFDTVRLYTCDYGAKLNTCTIGTFTNCNFESSVYKNLWLTTGVTSGPTKLIFNGCWIEDITGGSGTRYSLHLDMEDAVSATKRMDVLFNRCVITAPTGIKDVQSDDAQDVVFDHCAFSNTADKFTSAKFGYAANNTTRVKLIDCGTIQTGPTSALYASFPPLSRVSGGVYGFFYEFTQNNGTRETNYEVVSVSTDQTSLQIGYAKVLRVDTSSNSVTIYSFNGGSTGQELSIIKTSASNTLTLVHNGTGTQKMFLKDAANVGLTARRGSSLVAYVNTWYESNAT